MRNISFFLLIPLTVFAIPAYEDDVIIPQALQNNNNHLINNTTLPEEENIIYNNSSSNNTEVIYIQNTQSPSDYPPDVIIPKALQNNPSPPTEEIMVTSPLPQAPQSIAATRVMNHHEGNINNVVPKTVGTEYGATTVTTQILTPKTAPSIEESYANVEIPQIQGTYVLQSGVERSASIDHAMMVIEKLDEDDFGYYYVRKIGQLPSSGFPGIFHYDRAKKKFVNKVKETENTTRNEENIEIKFDGVQLETILSISVGKRAIIWNKVDKNCQADPSLIKSLSDIKESYTQIYKNNKNYLFD